MEYRKIFVCFLFFIFISNIVFAEEYIGYAEAVKSVQIRPEVTAKITKVHFNEGNFIHKSDSLFSLDSEQFQAELSLKKAELALAQAKHEGLAKYYARLKAVKRATSVSDLDMAESEERQAKAAVDAAKASLKIAEIQIKHATIVAPFEGRIGKSFFNVGSYVSPENVLCEIVQTDPIRILFAIPDRDYLHLMNTNRNLRYELTLADGSLFTGNVEKEFEDNIMNSDTGTINIWLKVSNENNTLLPGSLVRVKVIPGE